MGHPAQGAGGMWRLIWILPILAAAPAQAGPWPRGKGNHFLTFSMAQDMGDGSRWQGLYHEWGHQ